MSADWTEGRDPGLAAERTDLAWNRSGLSLLACGAAVMRGFSRPPLTTGNVAIGACMVGLGGFAYALGAWRSRRVRAVPRRRATPADLLPISGGVAIVGIAAFVIGALFPA
ncbi:MAG: DUF202 domain-containing protein [Acidimicrobiia bacterium]